MIPRDLHFAFPNALWNILWLIPLVMVAIWARYRSKNNLAQLISNRLLPFVTRVKDPWLYLARVLCFIFGWLFAVIALMQPIGNAHYPSLDSAPLKKASPTLDLYLLIDTSQSMNVADTPNKQTRLELAVDIADRLIANLKGDQVALFSLTSQLTPLVPLTYDGLFVRLYLHEIHLNEGDRGGTDFAAIFKDLPSNPGQAAILFSDGEDTSENKVQIEKLAAQTTIPIFTVGIGSEAGGTVPDLLWEGKPVTSRLDSSVLEAIAKASGGRYWAGTNSTALELTQNLDQLRITAGKTSSASRFVFDQFFQIPLALACLFFLLAYRLPVVRNVLLGLLLFSQAEANTAEQLFEAQQYNAAAAWYRQQLNELPPAWLRDKLLYNLAISLEELGDWHAAVNTLNALSEDAYRYPIFKERILSNQKHALMQEAEELQGNAKAIKLLEAAWLANEISEVPLSSPLTADEQNLLLEAVIRLFQLLPKEAQGNLLSLQILLLQRTTEPIEFLERASASISNDKAFLQAVERFYAVVLAWQKSHFQMGECQCAPWGRVMPLFTQGLVRLREGSGELEQHYAYDKWQAALELLKNPPPKHEEQSSENSELRELREMQALDREPKTSIKPSGMEGKPW